MIEDFKPAGAFMENTIRPFIGEIRSLLKELEAVGLPANQQNISQLLKAAAAYQIFHTVFTGLMQVVFISIVAYTVLHLK